MQVVIRHIDDGDGVHFTECHFSELEGLIDFIKQSGGVYQRECGQIFPFHSYQLVISGKSAYAEIMVGEEDDT